METTLHISPSLFERLQKHATPLVDTPITVIERMVDHYEATSKPKSMKLETSSPETKGKILDPLSPPDLHHTRVEGMFGNVRFRKWNELVRIAHVEAYRKAKSFKALLSVTHCQIKQGNHDGIKGYHYVPEIDVSVQGVDSCHAWNYALRLAQYCQTPLRVQVTWRINGKAVCPGETGVLEWRP